MAGDSFRLLDIFTPILVALVTALIGMMRRSIQAQKKQKEDISHIMELMTQAEKDRCLLELEYLSRITDIDDNQLQKAGDIYHLYHDKMGGNGYGTHLIDLIRSNYDRQQ